MKYSVIVPLVGYAMVDVEADNENEAKDIALENWCMDDVQTLDSVEHVVKDGCIDHPYADIEVMDKTDE